MDIEEKREKIASYIREGEKDPKDFKMGIEMERFLVDAESLESKGYFSKAGVEDLFSEIEDLGFEPHREGDHILTLTKDDFTVTTEPAAQVEISIEKKKSLKELDQAYKEIMGLLVPVIEKRGQRLLTLGYHPKTKVDQIEILPKGRYKFMYSYFERQEGATGKYMMKGTASTQTSIDFSSEEDFKKKYFLASALSPIFYSIFDNAPIFEGRPYNKRNLREYIRQYCDKRRSSVYPFAFDPDLSYARYAQEILETDSIFIEEDGEDISTDQTPFSEIFDRDSSEEMIFHALSIVRPDVRLKRYIEIRMPDSIPYPLNFSFLALVKGIFYDEENLDLAYEKYASMTYKKYLALREACMAEGIFARLDGRPVYDHALDLISLAKNGLCEEEAAFLDPLEEILEEKKVPRDYFEELYREDPRLAVEKFSVGGYGKD